MSEPVPDSEAKLEQQFKDICRSAGDTIWKYFHNEGDLDQIVGILLTELDPIKSDLTGVDHGVFLGIDEFIRIEGKNNMIAGARYAKLVKEESILKELRRVIAENPNEKFVTVDFLKGILE